MQTAENLQAAFAGESQANRKYLAFAKKAESDGFPQVARLFRAAAAAETIHAHAHFRAMDGVKSTLENVEAAMAGENHEFTSMYPPFLEQARKDGHKRAEISFRNALAVEEVHFALYSGAKEAVTAGKDLEAARLYVCEVCGHTIVGEPTGQCEVCGAAKERFTEIE